MKLFKRKQIVNDDISDKIHQDEVNIANESARNIKAVYIKLPGQKEVKIF